MLVLDPATARAFLAARPSASRPGWKGIVWLRTEHTPPPPAVDGFAGWERTWLAVPEAASFVAGSWAAARFHADAALAVDVDDGRLVVGVAAGTRPALRYRTALAARRTDGCPCAAPGAVFEVA